jgi:hypothetical protein
MNDAPKQPKQRKPIALAALKRAAKIAKKISKQTKTPFWVMEGDQIVDKSGNLPKPTK